VPIQQDFRQADGSVVQSQAHPPILGTRYLDGVQRGVIYESQHGSQSQWNQNNNNENFITGNGRVGQLNNNHQNYVSGYDCEPPDTIKWSRLSEQQR